MEVKEKGCVYFFRHVGLEPIKIGYSENKSPLKRFNQFKTYAPFGAQILGFIQTDEARDIERKLHLKYASKRLDGEWFNITEEEAEFEINFYTNKEDVKNRNDFQIEWAKNLALDKKLDKQDLIFFDEKLNNIEKIKKSIELNSSIKPKVISDKLNISLSLVYRYLREIKKNEL
jgi:ribosomal protein S25